MNKAGLHLGRASRNRREALPCLCTLIYLLSHLVSSVSHTCSSLDKFHFLTQNRRLVGYDIVTINTDGLLTCAQKCLSLSYCKSFNFDEASGGCDLNYETLSPGSLNTTHLVTSSYVFSDAAHWPERILGVCADHNCSINTICQPVDNTSYTCQLLLPTNCSEVKQCDSTSPDGEYLLRTKINGYQLTRVYCHNMSANPQEFLTLAAENYGLYPPIMNQYCSAETELRYNCAGKGGETWYNKIKINMETMKVTREDSTFANISNFHVLYAQAMDCYTYHYNQVASCGTVGRFTVNLTGTGWAVRPGTTWTAHGYRAIVEEVAWSNDGTVVQLKCGGFDGVCLPDDGLFLVPSSEGFPTDSASEVICPLL